MNCFQTDGYLILPEIIDIHAIEVLKAEIEHYKKQEAVHAIRDLHLKVPKILKIAKFLQFNNILFRCIGQQQFKLIKAIFFNKNQLYNWAVPWHQDKTIAVKQKANIPGYKNWTVKQGVPHV